MIRRVRARGLQICRENRMCCRPGPLTGRFSNGLLGTIRAGSVSTGLRDRLWPLSPTLDECRDSEPCHDQRHELVARDRSDQPGFVPEKLVEKPEQSVADHINVE